MRDFHAKCVRKERQKGANGPLCPQNRPKTGLALGLLITHQKVVDTLAASG
jgi:hypothetical protein